jgi:2,3-bisphosphoglycerate-independent phosphoglycerate mutase
MVTTNQRPCPLVLAILDGWGERAETAGNGIRLARTPNMDRWRATYPWTLIRAAEKAVGLPEGQMGNSEVGHLNIGAGFVVRQDVTMIDDSIADGSFFSNPAFTAAADHVKAHNAQLHIIGLLGTGGVHSHMGHEKALLQFAKRAGLERVFVHAFTDGRDTLPHSGIDFLRDLQTFMREIGVGRVATVSGRYYAMDRDRRWDRTEKAYNAMVQGVGQQAPSAEAAIQQSYAAGVTDEFIVPTVVMDGANPVATVRAGDAVICFNFRADRVRQITRAFVSSDFDGFPRQQLQDLFYVAMTEYEKGLPVAVAFEGEDVRVPLAKVLSDAGLKQLHVAETEKYAHVTYFLNGGREEPFPGEDRVLVPSPKVATYDLQPEMSAAGIRDRVLEALDRNTEDVIILNFANADMVGHSGNIDAVIKAVETVDACLGAIVNKVLELGGVALITADHGNAEQLIDPHGGGPFTAHTTNPVPFLVVAADGLALDRQHITLREGGVLADVAPTVLHVLHIAQPDTMTGSSLIQPRTA